MILSYITTLLLLNSSFVFLFRSWLGPLGTFYLTALSFILTFSTLAALLTLNLQFGFVFYLDFGRWFVLQGLIDSHLVFCADSLALLASLLVTFLATFVFYFGVEYMYREAFLNRLLYLLGLFTVSVVLLFIVYDFFLILISWELIGFFSFLLVNFYSVRIYTMKAAFKTFLFSRISDLFIFLAFILVVTVLNSTDLSVVFSIVPFFVVHYLFITPLLAINFIVILTVAIVLSSLIKGAQFFFHVWLPDAMEAPTPASALIHSSTLVIMGVYTILRFSLMFEFVPAVSELLALWGALTLGLAALIACFQNDIKKLVAFSTISQIGYLFCGCGFCAYEETLLYLIIHAANKAFLFMLVGYTVHFFSGNTDLRLMGGAYYSSFSILVVIFWIAINLAGLPYTAGFYAKEFLLFQLFRASLVNNLVVSMWFLGFIFTPIYMTTLLLAIFFGPKRGAISSYYELQTPNWTLYATLYKFYNSGGILSITSSLILSLLFVLVNVSGEFMLLVLFNLLNPNITVSGCSFLFIQSTTFFFTTTWSQWTLSTFSAVPIVSALVGLVYLVTLNKTALQNLFFEYRILAEVITLVSVLCLLG